MKKAEWQAVYAPQGDALERRVRQTLDGLEEKNRYAYPKRGAFIAAALVLALIAAAAVAAGLTRSARYDAKRLAYQALEEKYGFTTDMESGRLHRYDAERSGRGELVKRRRSGRR